MFDIYSGGSAETLSFDDVDRVCLKVTLVFTPATREYVQVNTKYKQSCRHSYRELPMEITYITSSRPEDQP
jgi:hypothetical protein